DARRPADPEGRLSIRRGSPRTAALRRDGGDDSRLAPQERAQLAGGAEQMHANGRLVETGHRADFLRRAVAVLAQHEARPLAAVQAIDGGRDARAAFTAEELAFGIGGAGCRGDLRFVPRREIAVHEPAIAPAARLASIQAAVDEDAREPDVERP